MRWAAEAGAAGGAGGTSAVVAHVLLDGAPDTAATSLADEVVIGGPDGHHLQRVRRLRVGEAVTVGDGRGRWRLYAVARSGAGEVGLVATGGEQLEPVLVPGLAVAFAITKGRHPEQVVQQLTELGVDRVLPVRAARSVVRWDHERAEAAVARLRRVAREAAMQCRRARVPVVEAVTGLGALTGHPGRVLADPSGVPADAVPEPPGGEWLLVVGPEGGFDPAEAAGLAGAPGLAVGPHVLRAETAAVAAAAALTGRRRSRADRGA